jgi:prepilin-type N-terminal cleavage/methylation domain-containing protein
MRRSRGHSLSPGEACRCCGMTLLEVMLAIVVILLGLVPLLHLLVKCMHVHQVADSLTHGTLMAESQLSELLAQSDLTEKKYQGRCESETSDIEYRWSATVEPLPDPMIESVPLTGLWHVTLTMTWAEARQDKEVTLETIVQNATQSHIQMTGSKTPSKDTGNGTL